MTGTGIAFRFKGNTDIGRNSKDTSTETFLHFTSADNSLFHDVSVNAKMLCQCSFLYAVAIDDIELHVD